MLTFFEFYETLLGFVLYKLYGELGVRYPLVTAATTSSGAGETGVVVSNPSLHPTLGGKATSVLAANLSALQVAIHQANQGNSAADAIGDALQQRKTENDGAGSKTVKEKKTPKAERKKQKQLMLSIDEALKGVRDEDDENADDQSDEDMDDEEGNVPIAAPLREALEAISDENGNNTSSTSNNDSGIVITDPEAQKRHRLFRNLTFFLSREVPRGYLELIILSFGGQVGWEGQDSPIAIDDPSITHHVVDRPVLLPGYAKLPKSRDYIQPQWIMDSTNFNFVLPIDKYGVGKVLPPHLSPWVEDKEEGYVPKYKEEIERLKNGEVLEEEEGETATGGAEVENESDAERDDKSASDAEEVPNLSNDDADEKESDEESGSEDDDEEDDEHAESKAVKKKETEVSFIIDIVIFHFHYCSF
jgi:pescadillo protein